MRRSIDQIRDYLYGGGYPDPVANAEQLVFLSSIHSEYADDNNNASRQETNEQTAVGQVKTNKATAARPDTGRRKKGLTKSELSLG